MAAEATLLRREASIETAIRYRPAAASKREGAMVQEVGEGTEKCEQIKSGRWLSNVGSRAIYVDESSCLEGQVRGGGEGGGAGRREDFDGELRDEGVISSADAEESGEAAGATDLRRSI